MKRYIRSTKSSGMTAADSIQKFIDGYGFQNFCVYPRDDSTLAVDVEGEDEYEVTSLLNRLHAWDLDADIYDHYIEINIADDDRFNGAITASDEWNPGWSKRFDKELQETYYVLAIPGKTATAVHFDDDGDFGYEVTLSGKAINKERKTFHGDDALDKAMTWAEKKLYKQSVDSSTRFAPQYRSGDVVLTGDADSYQCTCKVVGDIDNFPDELLQYVRNLYYLGQASDGPIYKIEFMTDEDHLFEENYQNFEDKVMPILEEHGFQEV